VIANLSTISDQQPVVFMCLLDLLYCFL